MNAWSTLMQLFDEELIDERQRADLHGLVRPASRAGCQGCP